MHRLDNALGEFEAGIDALESGSNEYEYAQEGEGGWAGEWGQGELGHELGREFGQGEFGQGEFGQHEQEAVFDEVQEMELAAELLEVNSEAELEQFLGKLVRSAGKAVGGFVRSPIGKALGGALKGVAKVALPMAGKVLGNMVLPGVGGVIGGKLASAAGSMFGLELEGMSAQDQEFEVARRVVRLSGEAVRQATQMPPAGSPETLAKNAVLAAATRHAPGLAARARGGAPRGAGGSCSCGGRGQGPRPARGGAPRSMARNGGNGFAGNGGGGAQPGFGPPQAGPTGGGRGPGLGRRGTWYRRGNTVVLTTGA